MIELNVSRQYAMATVTGDNSNLQVVATRGQLLKVDNSLEATGRRSHRTFKNTSDIGSRDTLLELSARLVVDKSVHHRNSSGGEGPAFYAEFAPNLRRHVQRWFIAVRQQVLRATLRRFICDDRRIGFIQGNRLLACDQAAAETASDA